MNLGAVGRERNVAKREETLCLGWWVLRKMMPNLNKIYNISIQLHCSPFDWLKPIVCYETKLSKASTLPYLLRYVCKSSCGPQEACAPQQLQPITPCKWTLRTALITSINSARAAGNPCTGNIDSVSVLLSSDSEVSSNNMLTAREKVCIIFVPNAFKDVSIKVSAQITQPQCFSFPSCCDCYQAIK